MPRVSELKKHLSLKSYFGKILFTLIVFIFIPLLVLGIMFYYMMSGQAMANFHKSQDSMLKDMEASLSASLTSIEYDLTNEYIDFTANRSSYSSKELMFYDISRTLSALVREHSLISSVYFYDKTSNRILNSDSGIYKPSAFYDTDWMFGLQYSTKLERLPVRYDLNSRFMENSSYNSIHVPKKVISIAIGSISYSIYIANIGIDNISDYLSNMYSFDGIDKTLYLDEAAVEAAKTQADSDSYIYLSGKMYNNLLDYTIRYDYESISLGYSYFIKYFIILSITLAVFLVILAGYVARRLYSPIGQLYYDVKTSTGNSLSQYISVTPGADELRALREVFNEINENQRKAIKIATLYHNAATSASLSMFLERNINPDAFKQMNPSLESLAKYRLVLITYKNSTDASFDSSNYKTNMINVLYSYLGQSFVGSISPLSDNRIGVLLASNDSFTLSAQLDRLFNGMYALSGEEFYFAQSNIIENIELLPDEYSSVILLLEYAEFFCCSDVRLSPDVFNGLSNENLSEVLINYETGLLRSIIHGVIDDGQKLIDTLFCDFKNKRVMYVINICHAIYLALDKELHLSERLNINFSDLQQSFRTINDYQDFFTRLLYDSIDLYSVSFSTEVRYCEAAKDYLENHYTENQDITQAAESLNISYPYLSKLFKNQYNVTLTDYLNSFRIERSCEFLSTSNYTLSEIAEKVGYNNIQSFQRFFKKYKNITPGDFRKLYQK